MKKLNKQIQVFLVGDNTCEVSGYLVLLNYTATHTAIQVQDDDSAIYEYHFPHAQVRMVRIYEEG